ncbi:HDOD domain-containing protein [Salidesulfovibrio brasiliensis]|uniref:HDOD domain-containing protein n=1 Tax=Salidesulfovibrio brasiliensis TaxID=221711 RepID=UPI0006CFFF68|nr:HDOD domain-containing protein [Salidesulfovibrio brasiliensis]
MGKVSINDARSGMVLESNLVTPDGRLFLAAGTVLTGSHLQTCKAWGIAEAEVMGYGEEQRQEPVADEESLAAAKELARHRFMVTNHRHPAVRELARQFAELTARRHDTAWIRKRCLAFLESPPTLAETPKWLNVEEIVGSELELATLPSIFHEINEALNDPRSSAAFVADVISKDVAISAKLLRLVNTPFYGFPSRIDTLSRAVTIVGVNQLTSLAMGISVLSAFEGVPEDVISLKDFWLHSIMCGTLARLFASHHGIVNEERFFVAGLLHDIGRLVMLRNQPDRALEPIHLGRTKRIAQYDAERARWGLTHAELGSRLLKEWQLPVFWKTLFAIITSRAPRPCRWKRPSFIWRISRPMRSALAATAGCMSRPSTGKRGTCCVSPAMTSGPWRGRRSPRRTRS